MTKNKKNNNPKKPKKPKTKIHLFSPSLPLPPQASARLTYNGDTMADVMMHHASENDMNAGNEQPMKVEAPVAPKAEPANALLAGACDDDDNELTEAQKKLIEERMKALQARFKCFEEKSLKQKVDELQMSYEGLSEGEAEMVLRVCNNNEFEAGDRLGDPEDGEGFIKAVRSMVREEQRTAKLKGRAAVEAEAKLARRQARLRKRKDGPTLIRSA